MYRLFKRDKCTSYDHYLLLASKESLNDISKEIEKRVRDGCPSHTLLVVQDVNFNLNIDIQYKEESNVTN